MNSSGKRHEVGAVARGLGARAARLVGIAGDVADGRIELRDRDRQAVGGTGVHGVRSSASGRLPGNRRRRSSDQADALGEREQPDHPGESSDKPDRGRAHVLDPADLRIDARW